MFAVAGSSRDGTNTMSVSFLMPSYGSIISASSASFDFKMKGFSDVFMNEPSRTIAVGGQLLYPLKSMFNFSNTWML